MAETSSSANIAILMANSGGGHLMAARSLAEALEGRAKVQFINLMDDVAPFPFNMFSAGYGPWVNYAPWLYEMVYRFGASRQNVEFVEDLVYPFVKRRLATAFAAAQPDLVISVHPLQTRVPLKVMREFGCRAPFINVVTDPVTAPVAWFCKEVDLCVVASAQARQTALKCGLAPEQVRVIGLPVRKAFAAASGRPKPRIRALLGVAPDRPLVLLTGGGAGIGKLLPLARAIARGLVQSGTPAQLAIIAGSNQILQQQLRAQAWPVPVTVLGFVEDMPNWLAGADLLVSKAGPGTLAEAACLGVPVIINSFVPGQEAGNITWVESHGAGIFAPRPEQVTDLIMEWLKPGDATLERMKGGALAMAQCDSAQQIAEAALEVYRKSL